MDSTERCQKRTNDLTTRFGKINVNKNTFLRLTNKIRIPKKKYSIQKLKKKWCCIFRLITYCINLLRVVIIK